jgi:RNA polymerase sigma factor (sigma-70 family)
MSAGAVPSPDPIHSLDEQDVGLLANGVRIIALRSLGDPDAAQDVAQETIARALRAIAAGRLRDRRAIGGFVRGIARHVIADELRQRHRTVALDPELSIPSGEADPLDALVHAEQVAAVHDAMQRLSPGDRRIIELSFVDGLTPAAVAERLREPPVRIRKRKSRALERLREALPGLHPRHERQAGPTLPVDRNSARAESGDADA